MRKTTFFKVSLLALIFLQGFISYSQDKDFVVFKSRYTKELKGDMLIIGNNILGKDNNSLDDSSLNQNISMEYIDIDGDNNTFSSSSANLIIPNSTSVAKCSKIVYAGLYWGAILQSVDRTDINKIKLKLPGNTAYNNITGELIYDAYSTPIGADLNRPYACYADVTDLLTNLPNAQGIYTVADVTSSLGINGSTGFAAGWTLFVVYEDLTATTKYINSFDGFSALANRTLEIKIDGFIIPSGGDVNLQYGFASLGGDKGQAGSKTKINTKFINATVPRPSNQFFSSSISDVKGYLSGRVPNSTNTLGYDTGIEQILRAAPSSIGYNDTNAKINLEMSSGQNIQIFSFFNAFAVDAIVPDIDLVKIVEDVNGIDIGGTEITLGQDLYYKITFKSIGSDQVTDFTLEDIIPENVVFNYPADVILPDGMTIANNVTYDAATRRLLFKIPDNLVKIGDLKTIRLHVKVVDDYNALSTACSSEIKNIAIANYRGIVNNKYKTESSFNSTACNFGAPSSTNFLANIDGHTFTRTVHLCNSAVLSASNGYDSYSWSTSPTGTPVVGTSQNFTVTETGTYYVSSISNSTCKSIKEEITVIPYGNITNPVIPYADEVVTCPNNGKELPYIFLCGANATKSIQTNIAGATIVWEKLNEASCAAITVANCANENTSCQWNIVGTGANFLVNTAGQFRVTINSGGCFSRFYFNVYQNLLSPTETHNDIICNTPGKITIDDVPEGYEYSLDAAGPYQDSNIFPNAAFPVLAAGSYTVYIKQKGVATNPCIFSVPNILIRKRNFSGSTIVTQPICNGDKGTIKIAAHDADPLYYYSIYQGATLVSSVGPISDSDYEFESLNPGTYTVRVWTNDGCDYSTDIEIIAPPQLEVTASLSKALTCVAGEITINVQGGTANYNYYVNGAEVLLNSALTSITVPVSVAGTYVVKVIDVNNCQATDEIEVIVIPKPEYTVSKTDVKCYGTNTGDIKFNVTKDNGYTLSYGISTDNGISYTFGTNPTISNLAAGDYYVNLKYSLDGSDCLGTPEKITITTPSTALTASGGVSELAGCDPSGSGYGKVRITNPQGGTPFPAPNPYRYSFDSQGTWVTTNEAYVASGTYTLYVKDANGCIFSMPGIILDPKTVAPTITVSSPIFNCDGSANSTVTVTNSDSSSFSYSYLLNGVANTNTADPKTFLNVPSGSHIISVEYLQTSVPTYSNLLNEDFGSGAPTTTSGINPAYCFENQQLPNGSCNGGRDLINNEYSVTNKIQIPWSGWVQNIKEHTNPVGDPVGRFLAIDIGSAAGPGGILYSKTIKDIIPNKDILVDFYAINLYQAKFSSKADPNLKIELVYDLGKPSQYIVPNSNPNSFNVPKTEAWIPYKVTLNPGSYTTLSFVIRSNSVQYDGNDVGIDDIKVYQLPKACITKVDFPFEVASGNAFTASITGFKNVTCAGANNGEITIAAQNFKSSGYQYTIDGTNWINVTTSPYTITGLSPANYNVQIRYDATSTGTCLIAIPQIITAPTAVTVTATITKEATCITGATITAVGAGGTPAYEYELRESDGTTVVTAFNNNNGIFTNVPGGSYTVFVRDANLCVSAVNAPVNIVAAVAPTATIVPSTAMCFDPFTGANITVNVSGGVEPYSYQTSTNGGTTYGVSSPTFAGPSFTYLATATGTYWFKITDSFGCFTTVSQVINAKLTAVTPVTTPLDCDVAPANQAIITGTISGGTAPFTVVKTSGAGSGTLEQPVANGVTFTYTTGVADTYTFEITDAIGCKTTPSATVNPLVPVTAKATVTDVTCFGANNGSIVLEGLTGAAPYEFNFDGRGFDPATTYSNLAGSVAGTDYTYIVKDSKGCTKTYTITVKQPAEITASAITTPYTCDGPATITATASGGNGSFTYTLNRDSNPVASNTVGTFNNLTVAGSYTVTVSDAKGCPLTVVAGTIVALNPPAAMTFTPSAVTCPDKTTTVTISDVRNSAGELIPTAGLTYTILAPAAATTNTTGASNGIFTDLVPGIIYTFEVKDANNCTFSKPYSVAPLPVFTVAGVVDADVQCLGETNGSATFTVSGLGNNVDYTYSLDTGASGIDKSPSTGTSFEITITGLNAGTHSITVTNTLTNCPVTASVTIAAPLTVLELVGTDLTHVTCNDLGTAEIKVTGGWGSFTYTVAPTAPAGVPISQYNNKKFINLPAGDYSFIVTDLKGCEVSGTFTINTVSPPTVTASVLNQCTAMGSTFQIKAVGADGVAPFTYTINTGVLPSPADIFTVATGDYIITLTDANGCTNTVGITVSPSLDPRAVLIKDLTCEIGNEAAQIDVKINGGLAGFGYTVLFNGVATGTSETVTGNSFTYNPTVAGTYQFEITDANGCTKLTDVITVSDPTPVTASVSKTDPTCNGNSDGSITLTGTAGEAPFKYSLTKVGDPVAPFVTYNVFGGLTAGTYNYIVRDDKGCEVLGSVTLDDPAAIVPVIKINDIECNSADIPGSIEITSISGGVAPFTFTLYDKSHTALHVENTSSTTFLFPNSLSFGDYYVTIVDSNGCEYTSEKLRISTVPYLQFLPPVVIGGNCKIGATVDLELDPGYSGVPNYVYSIYGDASSISAPTTDITYQFTGLKFGQTYYFQVVDGNNCTSIVEVAIPALSDIKIDPITTTNVSCNTSPVTTNGTVNFTISDYDSSVTELHLEVLDQLTNMPLATPVFKTVPVNGLTSISESFSGLAAGSYTLQVIEVDGTECSASVPFEITQPTQPLNAVIASWVDATCDKPAQVRITTTGGKGPYTYAVAVNPATPTSFNLGNNVLDLDYALGTDWNIIVKDANGCTFDLNTVIAKDPEPKIALAIVDKCADDGTFEITVSETTAGTGTYSIKVDNSTFVSISGLPYTISGLYAGNHDVIIKDANGCTDAKSIVIDEPLQINASFTTPPSCFDTNGTITAVVSGGATPNNFEYTLVNNTAVAADIVQVDDPVFLDQAAGNYTVTVKDLTTNCVKSVTVDLLIPTAVDFTLATTSPYCITGQGNEGNGTITVTLVNNDNPNYTYTIVQTVPPTGLSYTQNTPVFTGLAVGFYDITVTSARGCSDTKNVEITAPAPVVAVATASPFTCSATNTLNATIVTVTGTGGAGTGAIADYKYSKDRVNWRDENTFTVYDTEAVQNLTYYVRDANGCIDDYPIIINPFPKLISATTRLVTKADCLNLDQEMIGVDIVGGATPYNFEYQVAADGGLFSIPATVILPGENSFEYLATMAAGHFYQFKITDRTTGCSILSDIYNVPVYNTMQVIASVATHVDCNGNNTGAIEINITGYSGAYSYEVFNGATSVFTGAGNTSVNPFVIPFGLVAGNKYRVEVTQTAYPSCTVTSTDVIISEPTALDIIPMAVDVKNQNCNNAGAVLTVDVATIVGGTLGYEYAFVATRLDPAGSYSPSPTKTIPTTATAAAPDQIDVYVKDANGCYEVVTVPISADPLPAITDVTVDNQCADANGYRIDVVATGVDPLKYSLDGVQFQDDAFFTVFAAGDYTVTVMDNNGCITTATTAVTVLKPLTLRGEVSLLPTCKDADGEITLYAAGGTVTPPNSYEYTIDDWANSQVSAVFSNLAPGIYDFKVRDLVTLCEKEVQVIIDAPTDVIGITATPTAVTCKGGSDGSILVSLDASNNNPIYTYALSGPVGFTARSAQESPLFENLPAGSYTVTVTSGRGCEAQGTAVVVEPNLIVVPAPTVDGFGCTTGNSLNFATISVDPTAITGGSTDYVNYEFIKGTTQVYFGPNSQYTEYDLLGGTYIVNVYDDKGCMGSTTVSVTIDPYIRLESADVTVTAAITCLDGESIQVNTTTNSAIPPVLDYAITDAAGNAVAGNPNNQNGIFTALPIGNYIITVSNPDTGCSIQTVHYVNNPNTFVLKAVKTKDVVCFGSNEGTVELTIIDNQTNPDDEAGAFSYVLTRPDGTTVNGNSPDKGPFNLTGLTAGLYSVTATLIKSPFCSASTSFTIVQAAAVLDITKTQTAITCVAGNNDGSISVSATGGWPGGYEFEVLKDGNLFSAYSTQTEFTGLTAGIYRINVRDSKGCVDFVEVALKNPDPIVFTATPSTALVSCFGDTSASIEVTTGPTGGSGSYLYTLISTFADGAVTSNGPQVSPIFPNLGAGDYVVKVTDSWHCSAVSATPIVINEPTKVVASLVTATTITCDNDATLTLSATGGTGPYTYSVDNIIYNPTPFVTSVTFAVPIGTYHYYVRDANGCTSYISNDIRIDPLEALIVTLNTQNAVINCKGDNTGVIVANATGGLGNYVYTLLDGAGTAVSPAPIQTTAGRFDGLFAGFYQVKVESGDCGAVSTIIEIREPATALAYTPEVTDVTCNGEDNGKIEIIASGGTGKIMYAISPRLDQFFDLGVFDELAVGSYQVVIQDEKGCFIVHDFEIKEPMPLMTSTIVGSIVEEICAGDNDGAFSIAIAGGTLPYSVSLDNPNGTYTTGTATQTEFDFTDLSGGNHFVFIRDANGCTTDWLVALPESINMNPIAVVQYDCVNNAAVNTVSISIDDSITDPIDVDYALDGSADFGPSSVFTDLAPGPHFVTARHSNGCEQQTMIFDIVQVDPLTLVLNDGGLNEVVAVATGGGGGYTYTLNGESYGSTSNFIIYKSGEYTVTVADANGCVASVTKYMEHIDVCIPNYFTPNGDGVNDGWAPGCTENYKNLLFSIFDRYGRKVGEYRTGQYWDGKYNGAELPSGDYWYVLRLNDMKDAREFVGHFTLYR